MVHCTSLEIRAGRESLAGPSLLADRTVEGRARALDDAPDRAAAARARTRLALAVVDAEPVLKQAELAVGTAVVAQRRAARLDGIAQHCADRLGEPLRPFVRRILAVRERRGAPLRGQRGPV